MSECQLCGRTAPLAVAQLRIAFSDSTTLVNVCARCSGLAWRTVGELHEELRRRAPAPRPGAKAAAFVCEARA